MRGIATIAALVAGCGFSASLPSSSSGDGGTDARTIDAPADDRDADGVKNIDDNCPDKPNTGQFDEDDDDKGDECDPCPHLGGVLDQDIDNDGIGNGCDPRPTLGGDMLVYWNGFNISGGLPAGMTMIHGSAERWSVVNNELVFTPNSNDWGVPAVDAGGVNHTTDSSFQIAQSFGGTASAAGVVVDVKADDSDMYECQARTDFQRRQMYRRVPAAPDGWTELESANVTTPNDTYRIELHRRASDLACNTTRLDQPSVALANGADSSGNTRAGLFARNVSARFKYIAVYRSP